MFIDHCYLFGMLAQWVQTCVLTAMAAGHEEVALVLAQDIKEVVVLLGNGTTVLRMACKKKLFELLRYIRSGPGRHTNEQTMRDRSSSLSHVLWNDCHGLIKDFATNRLLESTY
jgi:hypothetical protein